MDKFSLQKKLIAMGVSKSRFSLDGGIPNEKLCLEELTNKQWHIYYSERGSKTTMSIWNTEAEACEEFFRLILEEYQ